MTAKDVFGNEFQIPRDHEVDAFSTGECYGEPAGFGISFNAKKPSIEARRRIAMELQLGNSPEQVVYELRRIADFIESALE